MKCICHRLLNRLNAILQVSLCFNCIFILLILLRLQTAGTQSDVNPDPGTPNSAQGVSARLEDESSDDASTLTHDALQSPPTHELRKAAMELWKRDRISEDHFFVPLIALAERHAALRNSSGLATLTLPMRNLPFLEDMCDGLEIHDSDKQSFLRTARYLKERYSEILSNGLIESEVHDDWAMYRYRISQSERKLFLDQALELYREILPDQVAEWVVSSSYGKLDSADEEVLVREVYLQTIGTMKKYRIEHFTPDGDFRSSGEYVK